MATAIHAPSMWSFRAATAGRLRLAVATASRQAAPPSRLRLAHLATRACAGGDHSNGNGASQHFTVTTPLYYVNAGAAGRLAGCGALGPPLGNSYPVCVLPPERTHPTGTPLFPAPAAPHMGSAYPTIAADAIARFQRLQGHPVTFITGTDEHGEKIALAAEKRGMAPKEHCDDIVASYKQLWRDVGAAAAAGRRSCLCCCPGGCGCRMHRLL